MALGGRLGSTYKGLERQGKEFGLWPLGKKKPLQTWVWAPRAPGILGPFLLTRGPSVIGSWTRKKPRR